MRRGLTTSRAFRPLAVLVLLMVATVIAAVPLETKPGEQQSRLQTPTAGPAPSAAPILRLRPRLALHARAAADAPRAVRLRISAGGSFRPTTSMPARLRVALAAVGASRAIGTVRFVRPVAMTDAVRSAVFRHLRPGTWRWQVAAARGWTLALVRPDTGRVVVTAPSPPNLPAPEPAPEPAEETTVQAGLEAPSQPTLEPAPATTSVQPGTPTHGGGGGGGGLSDQPSAPFDGAGPPSPEGPHAP